MSAPSDSFETFPDDRDPHHHDPPPIPEPQFYGALLAFISIVLVLLINRRRA